MNIWQLVAAVSPTHPAPLNSNQSDAVRRIVLIRPCCIGDVVLATATLQALRRAYPNGHITWAVGSWSKQAIEHHDLLDAVLDTGSAALPVRSLSGMVRFVRQLRAGNFDLAVSLVRSPLMSLAVGLSGIPHRVGLDSAGRGFGYTVRVAVDPEQPRHEGQIYLDAARALGLDVTDCWANVPVRTADQRRIQTLLAEQGVQGPFLVINPAGGSNPGMVLDVKRWPPAQFAALATRLAERLNLDIVLVAGPDDWPIVNTVQMMLKKPAVAFTGVLEFWEIAALAQAAKVYVGNDTGLTHLAAAAGAKTVMILGPSDPVRYAPFTIDSLALWKPTALVSGGVAAGTPEDWDWARDGIGVDEAEQRIANFLKIP